MFLLSRQTRLKRWNVAIVMVIFMTPFLMGTTYIIKEGDVEVGRYEEADGKDAIQVIENDVPEVPPVLDDPREESFTPSSEEEYPYRPGGVWFDSSKSLENYSKGFRMQTGAILNTWVKLVAFIGIGGLLLFLVRKKFGD